MISKELLSVVYPIDETTETYVSIQESTGRVMWFGKEYNDCRSEIDIHRVAHKCKEWVIKYSGWTLQSYTNERGSGICRIKVGDGQEINKLIASFEPEAIFKACQWILNKDSK